MALKMEDLRKLLEAEGLRYFLDPKDDAVSFGAAGPNGRYQFYLALQVEGRFLQFRTVDYLSCPPDHPHRAAVLEVLGVVNLQRRFAKFSWNPLNGEIVVFADHWIMDGTVTQEQFNRICGNYFSCVDGDFKRIQATIETGKDPEPMKPPAPEVSEV